MDQDKFDRFTRSLGGLKDRRGVIRELATGVVAGVATAFGIEAEGEAKGKHGGHGKNHHKGGNKSAAHNKAAKKAGAKSGAKASGKKGHSKNHHHKGSVKAQTVTTDIPCSCADNLSPKGCPNPGDNPQYTCKAASSGTGCGVDGNNAPKGSVQVGCDGSTPYCYCQSTKCVVNGVTYKKGDRVNKEGGTCQPVPCPSASCDDNISCTVDTCNTSTGLCERTLDNSKCDDSNACTTDTCDPDANDADANGCTHTPISCDDGKVCTTDTCDPATGCKHDAVVCPAPNACKVNCACSEPDGCACEDRNCDDGDACTDDSCDPETGCVHTPINCDDGNACTVDSCDSAKGCVHEDLDCDDGNACTIDSCDPSTGCVYTDVDCDDGDACTVDTCNPQTGCVHTPVVCPDKEGCVNNGCSNGQCQYTCTCTSDESPKGCPDPGDQPQYTCKRCPGLTMGSPQVICSGTTPSCVCQNQSGCTINGTNYPKGTDLTAAGICEPVSCSTGDPV